jgi:uncharacterized protein YjiS (DUF1127 family)
MKQSIQVNAPKVNIPEVNILKVNLSDGYKNLVTHIRMIQQKRQTRRQLAKLPDYLLKDVNINRAEAQQEVRKSFFIMK